MMNVNVDLNAILDVVQKGVRRASAFMGLGINAAIDPEFKRVHLDDEITNLRFLPDVVPDEALVEIKKEFRLWIEAGGFRELCESWELFLTKLYRTCLLFEVSQEGRLASSTMIPSVPRSFERKGLGDKLDEMSDRFGVAAKHPQHLKSLWRARNCLGHRRGVVGHADVDNSGALTVSWLGADTLFIAPDGSEKPLPPGFEPFVAANGGEVAMRFLERSREFKMGERLALSTHDLSEICWAFLREAHVTIASAAEFAKARGVQIRIETDVLSRLENEADGIAQATSQ